METLAAGKYYSIAIDPATRGTVIKLMDKATGGVIFQIPPEEALRMAAELRRKCQAR